MIRLLLLIWTVLVMPGLSAQQALQLEVIPLQHRMVEDIIPVVRPLLPPGSTVTGMNDRLIVKSTPTGLAEVKRLLTEIDRAARRLLITVTQDGTAIRERNDAALSGRVTSGDVSIGTRAEARPEGLVISGRDAEGNEITYSRNTGSASTRDSNRFSVQTLEGQPAWIQSGVAFPVPTSSTVITRNGVVVSEGTDYAEASSGFYVLARLAGDQVTLQVAPQLSALSPGRRPEIAVQAVSTTVSGRLGEWLEIGGLSQSRQSSGNSGGNRGQSATESTRSVLIKVDEIR